MVFDEHSGETHQFSPLAAAAMAWLEESPSSVDALTVTIATELGAQQSETLRAAVEAIVQQFAQLGWIESDPLLA